MSNQNETATLVLTILITTGVIGGGFWWFTAKSDLEINQVFKKSPNNTQQQAQSQSPAHWAIPAASETSQTFAQVPNVPTGLFNYGGSTSWAPIRQSVDVALQTARAGFRLRYVDPIGRPPSSSEGIQMLLDGKLSFAQSSRPLLQQEYSQAKQRGFELQQIPVAIDGLVVAVNPALSISGITLAQLKSIYTGQVTNWNQVGGPNLNITPYSRPADSGGTVELLIKDIMNGERFGNNVQFVNTTTVGLRKLAKDPGGIYFASAPEVVPQCTVKPLPVGRNPNQLVTPYQKPLVPSSQCPAQRNLLNIEAFRSGEYPITRNLFVVVKKNGQLEEEVGIAYKNLLLSAQGQELVGQIGFVRIR